MMLGYSDQSAFTKAFKRWTADTPQAWRMRHSMTRIGVNRP
jgi:AraC-like DNA-binding protein